MNNQTNWSNLNGTIDTVAGDAAVQGAAGGNMMDITTMNNTMVNNSQIVGSGAAIGSNINVGINNIGGSVGIQNQAVCNGVSVSTDPTFASTRNYQECDASRSVANRSMPHVTNVAGDAAIQGASLGNSFEADSNAPNMPIFNKQINNAHGGFDGQRQCLQCRWLDQPVLQRHRQYRPDHPLQHQLRFRAGILGKLQPAQESDEASASASLGQRRAKTLPAASEARAVPTHPPFAFFSSR